MIATPATFLPNYQTPITSLVLKLASTSSVSGPLNLFFLLLSSPFPKISHSRLLLSFQISAENTTFSVLCFCFFFFEMRTFKIYSQQLSNMQYSITNCSTHFCTLHPHVMEWGWKFVPFVPLHYFTRMPPPLAWLQATNLFSMNSFVWFFLPSFLHLFLFTYK